MGRGRPPLGPRLVDGMKGSPEAKRRLHIVLETMTGRRTIAQACQLLQIGEARFYELRSRALAAARRSPTPRSRSG